jgi:hypothetical protein
MHTQLIVETVRGPARHRATLTVAGMTQPSGSQPRDSQPRDSQPSDIRTRLQRALTEALKARDTATVSVVRSALGAIGNAEAVAADPAQPSGAPGAAIAGAVAGLGAAEVPRRPLTEADVAAIVRAEAAEREVAAAGYERSGYTVEATRLRRGAERLIALLDC